MFEEDFSTRYSTSGYEGGGGDEFDMGATHSAKSVRATVSTVELERPLEEMAALGLLLAAHEGASRIVPAINLAYSLPDRAEEITTTRAEDATAEHTSLRRRIKVAAFVPVFVALGLVFGAYAMTVLSSYRLKNALETERAEQARLAPVAARRKAATEAMTWVSAYLQQVTELRRRQPAPLSLLAALDERYPVTEDESFTVKTLSASADGTIQITGLTKRDEAIAALISKLEYSPTDEAGNKLFERPVYELRRPQIGGVNLPGLPSAGPGNLPSAPQLQSTRPDVTAFTVRFIYTPLRRDSAVAAKPAGKDDKDAKASEKK
jgi:hypothetical protein